MGKPTIPSKNRHRKRSCLSQSALAPKERKFLHGFEAAGLQMPSTTALQEVHQYIRENKIQDLNEFRTQAMSIFKICSECDRWSFRDYIITCEKCQDHYHPCCYIHFHDNIQYQEGKFFCDKCLNPEISPKKCKECKETFNGESQTVQCQQCQHEYHGHCMLPLKRICKTCSSITGQINAKRKSKRIKKEQNQNLQKMDCSPNLRNIYELFTAKKDVIVKNELLGQRQGCEFKALTVLEDKSPAEIERYKQFLVSAIQKRQMNYTEYLHDILFYTRGMQQRSVDFGLGSMTPQEMIQYRKYKAQPIGPFLLILTSNMGFDVVTDMRIGKGCIICEYVGEVMTLRECGELDKEEKNDSMMELWVGRNADQTLVIRPKKWTNIGRFLNGVRDIGCSTNVMTVRVCYQGLPLVLLIAKEDIQKGERLYYNYNAGNISAPIETEHFV